MIRNSRSWNYHFSWHVCTFILCTKDIISYIADMYQLRTPVPCGNELIQVHFFFSKYYFYLFKMCFVSSRLHLFTWLNIWLKQIYWNYSKCHACKTHFPLSVFPLITILFSFFSFSCSLVLFIYFFIFQFK